ncbi:MAG: histidine kinase [Micrococcaceae bacterium]|uniref:sensor histidine kinase n=1 Tax=Arthrobacter sp. AOP36-C1-22 TaxID=3457683 RepID=UPI002650203A|nr:histidine kinase [Micrococcaceae bacterium]
MNDTERPVLRVLSAIRREDILLALGYPAMMWLLFTVNNDGDWAWFPPAFSAWWPAVAAVGSVGILFRRGTTFLMASMTGTAVLVLLLMGQTTALFLLWETVFSLVLFAGDRVSRMTEIASLVLTAVATLSVLAVTAELPAAVLTALIAGMSLLLPAEWASNVRKERKLSAAEATRAQAAEDAVRQQATLEAARHELAVASERQRMAHELHDVLSARLSAIALQTGAALSTGTRELAAEVLSHVRKESVAGLNELTSMIRILSSGDAQEAAGFLADLDSLVAAHAASGTRITLSSTVSGTASIPSAQQTAVYRVVAESLVNALRHAPGANIAVVVQGGPAAGLLHVRVTNSPPPAGPGSAADAGEPGTGTGLRSLRLRVEQLGGELTAAVHDGGWQVSVRLPVRASEEDLEHSGAGLAGRASVPPAEGPA